MTILSDVTDDLVSANRILAGMEVLDGFGHVSARHPDRADRFLLSRSLAPALVTADDIMTFDFASSPVDSDARTPYVERFIHGGIYARRPDVHAIVHSHSAAVVPFAASSVRLRPIYHMSSFLRAGAPVFDIRTHFGLTDMLIRNAGQGTALADELGYGAVVLMRGHGFCAVGDSIPNAVFRAVYTQSNASLQQQAIALGGTVTYLEDDEAEQSEASNRRVIARPWELWKTKYRPASNG